MISPTVTTSKVYKDVQKLGELLPTLPTGADNIKSTPADTLVGIKADETPTNTDAPVGFKKIGDGKKQVFHIEKNVYTYDDSQAVCKAFGSELATYEQLLDAYKQGADWCSVGWSKGQLALYPTQYKTWLKMQENEPARRNMCGETAGIQGSYQENKNLLFGVNCYGVKPSPRGSEKMRNKMMSDKDRQLQKRVSEIKLNLPPVAPHNEDKWSSC
jgi:hypothetical protein